MMPKLALSILLFASLLLSLSACQPLMQQPGSTTLPLTGKETSRLGAAALTLQQKTSSGPFSIVPVSVDTGKAIPDAQPVQLGSIISYSFSADRGQLAFLANQTPDCPFRCLHLLDLRSWKEMMKPVALSDALDQWVLIPTFISKNERLAVILNKQTETNSQVQLVDLTQAKVITNKSLPANIMQAAYTPDGALAVYGIKTSSSAKESLVYLALLDGKDLHTVWEKTLPDIPFVAEWAGDPNDPTQGQYLDPAVTFSPDGSKLYLVAADKPLLVTVDFQQKTIHNAVIQPRVSLLDRLMASTAQVVYAKTLNGISKVGVLSQNGRYLYVVGQERTAIKKDNGDYDQKVHPLGLQVIDTKDGTLINSVPTEANNVALSLDGKRLLLTGWSDTPDNNSLSWTDVLDTTSFKVVQRLKGTASPSRLLDGSLVWLVNEQNNDSTYQINLYRPGETTPRIHLTGPTWGMIDWIPIP
jgi:hypothetical protein